MDSFKGSSSQFSCELYQNAVDGVTGNLVFSPLSLLNLLTLAYFGATGMTARDIKTSLKYSDATSDDDILNYFSKLNKGLSTSDIIKSANKIYVNEALSVKPSFNEIATSKFYSEASSINFGSPDASQKINDWVAEKTNNKIKNLYSLDSFSADTSIVLMNAVYFKAFWSEQFDPLDTFKSTFFTGETESILTDFMHAEKYFKYGEFAELNAKAIELPYKSSEFTMMILLPYNRTGLSQVEQKMNQINLFELSSRMESKEVTVKIPKFKIESKTEMNTPLMKMGMSRMFTAGEMNKMVESPVPQRVSDVSHKAFIEVYEKGTEAAAATGIKVVPLSLIIKDYTFFLAEHPFIFAIKDASNIYFMGRVVVP